MSEWTGKLHSCSSTVGDARKPTINVFIADSFAGEIASSLHTFTVFHLSCDQNHEPKGLFCYCGFLRQLCLTLNTSWRIWLNECVQLIKPCFHQEAKFSTARSGTRWPKFGEMTAKKCPLQLNNPKIHRTLRDKTIVEHRRNWKRLWKRSIYLIFFYLFNCAAATQRAGVNKAQKWTVLASECNDLKWWIMTQCYCSRAKVIIALFNLYSFRFHQSAVPLTHLKERKERESSLICAEMVAQHPPLNVLQNH